MRPSSATASRAVLPNNLSHVHNLRPHRAAAFEPTEVDADVSTDSIALSQEIGVDASVSARNEDNFDHTFMCVCRCFVMYVYCLLASLSLSPSPSPSPSLTHTYTS